MGFLNLEDAERAAKTFTRVTGQGAQAVDSVTEGHAVHAKDGAFTDWESLANHLVAFYQPLPSVRAVNPLTNQPWPDLPIADAEAAKSHLRQARNILTTKGAPLAGTAAGQLLLALECLLGVA